MCCQAIMHPHEAKVPVHRQAHAGSDEARRVGNTRHAGHPVFPGDDGAVDQHASAPLDHRSMPDGPVAMA